LGTIAAVSLSMSGWTITFSVVSAKVILMGVGWYMPDTGINGTLLSGGKTANQPITPVCNQAVCTLSRLMAESGIVGIAVLKFKDAIIVV